MLTFLTTYWHILSALGLLALALIRLYIRFHDLEKEQKEHKEQHKKDIEQVKADHIKDMNMIKSELDEIKDNYMSDVKEILQKLNTLSDAVSKIQGYIEGQQSKTC